MITSIASLFCHTDTTSLTDLADTLYSSTGCGVNLTFLTADDEIYASDIEPHQDRSPWPGDNVLGLRINTIVEGSEAEFTGAPLLFPFSEDAYEAALQECEDFANDMEADDEDGD